MRSQEKLQAEKLAKRLVANGIQATISGGGVHWQVDVLETKHRSMTIHCFWYERALSGLFLGMNSANSRSHLKSQSRVKQHEGVEYYVELHRGSERISDGRTYNIEDVVQCTKAWLAGATSNELAMSAAFINEKRRAMESIAARLDSRLTWDIGGDPAYDLWVYGDKRSCCVSGNSCAFYVGKAQVALKTDVDDLINDIALWILDNIPIPSLVHRGIKLERHAQLVELDPARWHWLHVLDRIADPEDVLFPLAPLIERLAENPIVSQFYSFSSLNRFSFSASSHYPWVGNFPMVSYHLNSFYVGDTPFELDEAIPKIEAALALSPVRPFFGSSVELETKQIAELLLQKGSRLTSVMIRRGLWSDTWIVQGDRQCRIQTRLITCFEKTNKFSARTPNLETSLDLAISFLEELVSLEEILTDSRWTVKLGSEYLV